MSKPLSLYLFFACFNPDMVLNFPLLLHAWTDLKSIFLDFVCRKGLPLTNKKFVDSSTCWWCLDMRRVKGILGVVLWCYVILLIVLPCMIGILGSYMSYALLVLFLVIVQFLIWFFSTDSFKVCVDSHLKSCCSNLDPSDPLVYFL